jgi:hypothetical protein
MRVPVNFTKLENLIFNRSCGGFGWSLVAKAGLARHCISQRLSRSVLATGNLIAIDAKHKKSNG